MIKNPGGAVQGGAATFSTVTATNLTNIIARNAIPFIVAPTGTMANNGAITVGTALGATYPSCYLNLPASAISAGSGAGWYFAQMSSATVGTVFNNTYTTGLPTIPGAPTPFATTGPGAYTGVTSLVVGPQITLPANSIGPNGILRTLMLTNELNNANVKTLNMVIGAGVFINAVLASVGAALTANAIFNQGSQAVQVSMPSAGNLGFGTANGNLLHNTVNFAVSQTIQLDLTMAVATDWFALEGFLIEAVP